MPFAIFLVFQDGQNKFGRSGSLLYHYFFNLCLYPDNDDDHENAKLETLFNPITYGILPFRQLRGGGGFLARIQKTRLQLTD